MKKHFLEDSQGEGLQEEGIAAVENHTGLLSVSGITTGEEADLRTTQRMDSHTFGRDAQAGAVAAVHTLT